MACKQTRARLHVFLPNDIFPLGAGAVISPARGHNESVYLSECVKHADGRMNH